MASSGRRSTVGTATSLAPTPSGSRSPISPANCPTWWSPTRAPRGLDPAQPVAGRPHLVLGGPAAEFRRFGAGLDGCGTSPAAPFPDILVTNSGSNDVTLLPASVKAFFNDQNPRSTVGPDPVTSFVGNFDGQSTW